jgi:hypothetical protein
MTSIRFNTNVASKKAPVVLGVACFLCAVATISSSVINADQDGDRIATPAERTDDDRFRFTLHEQQLILMHQLTENYCAALDRSTSAEIAHEITMLEFSRGRARIDRVAYTGVIMAARQFRTRIAQAQLDRITAETRKWAWPREPMKPNAAVGDAGK